MRILIAARSADVRRELRALASRLGFHAVEALDAETAERGLLSVATSLMVVAEENEDLALVHHLRSVQPGVPVLLFPAHSSETLAIRALKAGVSDFIRQPHYDELAAAILRIVHPAKNVSEAGDPGAAPPLLGPTIAGESAALERMRQSLRRAADVDCTVLITGETGTGKDLAAQAIHQNSARRAAPFVTLNCAAIPDELMESELFGFERGAFTGAHSTNTGKLMQAGGGTVFLDEIGELNALAQAKLLRVIENKEVQRLGGKYARPVDIRIVAATNQNLEQLVAQQRFRRDLFFRLNVIHLRLPPLRERREDIPALAGLFLADLNKRMHRCVQGFSADSLDVLLRHSWPGNVRELKNLIEALLVDRDGGWISAGELPDELRQQPLEEAGANERTIVLRALQSARWNRSKAAQILNWSRMTLYRKMAKHEILPQGRRNRSKASAGVAAGR